MRGEGWQLGFVLSTGEWRVARLNSGSCCIWSLFCLFCKKNKITRLALVSRSGIVSLREEEQLKLEQLEGKMGRKENPRNDGVKASRLCVSGNSAGQTFMFDLVDIQGQIFI